VDYITNVESHVFADTSHCTHLEKPEEFRAVVAAFLTSHDAVARI
jgi:L-proline amide hydrolase